ncbi:MTAP family purine nucleoside phosphorylase [archaeon]|jgi:5'-methylthioadenosine phosphorylase|nr:MTAP family purine nucleoside phosphorylase [archaeon]MBT4352378.1 MTAP family purine nucleoside phosphorylase [archaeon]MBT4646629.1 MTAP family purine nucleoside phosphorylase [archaeon]MBT6821921.1 MTAP family purine nucleoside phosphorylase [archaeon]MBT7393188.1 MTAP family purine nucleoside phosphorylase [archaeon]
MIDLAIISGSGFYDFEGLINKEEKIIKTEFGDVNVLLGELSNKKIAYISRHGKNHELLPNMINHRANIFALKQLGAKAIISTTVCGLTNSGLDLAKIIVFDDLYYPDNRLPSGEVCSIYKKPGDKKRGHLIFSSLYNKTIREIIIKNNESYDKGTYGYVNGPRFNSRSEVKMLLQFTDAISQSAGPEVVLAGELEIPIVLLGFGIDYANGASEKPTPIDVLNDNLKKSKDEFKKVILSFLDNYEEPQFDGFVYRFE